MALHESLVLNRTNNSYFIYMFETKTNVTNLTLSPTLDFRSVFFSMNLYIEQVFVHC